MATDSGPPLVFPVGHYMGPFHAHPGAPAKHYAVRLGWDTPKLPTEEHLDVWALAHGLPDRIHDVRWTRAAIINATNDAGLGDAGPILDDLRSLGLIVEVSPGTDTAVEFARSYRMQSLLVGLGNPPDDPVYDGIGLPGLPPMVKVPARVYQLWQWGPLWPDLWTACEALSAVARETGTGEPGEEQPEGVLDFALGALRTLIAGNAAYLDRARRPR